jgi:iron complex outermembrane receptor protein
MKRIVPLITLIISLSSLFSQNSFTAFIKDEDSNEPLSFCNVIVEGSTIGSSADENGLLILKNIPNGKQSLIFSFVGYRKDEKIFKFPMQTSDTIVVYLEKSMELKTVYVVSMRTNNRIEEIPTRVEVLGNEEVIEETGINPGNISKLLGETSGITVQQTSAVSGNVSFRILGLPGKYTQLLKDGFPSYTGFASGLSLLQIPPLDLRQVEIIKGSSSTLYGGNAIAGIVNLISKIPTDYPELSILINHTTNGGNDLSSFYAHKKGKMGVSLLASFNTQVEKDISGNDFSDIPKYDRVVIMPTFFFNPGKTNTFKLGFTATYENRLGGNIYTISNLGNDDGFYENNQTKYLSAILNYKHDFKNETYLTFKSNITDYSRNLITNINSFGGEQTSSFSELSCLFKNKRHNWTSSIDLCVDEFKQYPGYNYFSVSYKHQTIGIFSQDNWKLTEDLSLEPGIRYDYNFQYGGFFLPRLALLYKFSNSFSSRLSGGLGYKLPTPFSEDAERTRYQNIIFPSDLKAEKSQSLNMDFTFKTSLFDDLFLSVNQAFFMVQISNPIIADSYFLGLQGVFYENAEGNLLNKGLNTNIRLSFDELVLYIDYTFVDSRKQYDKNKQYELTPKNRLTSTLAYEDEERGWKFGLEAFYIGNQYLVDATISPDYWLLGASAQKTIKHYTIVLNAENILNIRQTRYEDIVSGNLQNPVFSELYAPLDGFVGNIVLKFDLY